MMHFFPVAHLFDGETIYRAEKDRSQFASENNDLRAAMDHMSSEKVLTRGRPKLRMLCVLHVSPELSPDTALKSHKTLDPHSQLPFHSQVTTWAVIPTNRALINYDANVN
jgi:hypothetical protein